MGAIQRTDMRPLDIFLYVPKAGPFLDRCLVSVDDLLGRGYTIVSLFAMGFANYLIRQLNSYSISLVLSMLRVVLFACESYLKSACPRYVQGYTPGTKELHPNVWLNVH